MDRPPVVIGVPTFRRPIGLGRLLESIRGLDAPEGTRVVVCENDSGGAGAAVVAALAPDFPFPLAVVHEPARGIPHARNRLLRAAFEERRARALAMVDDDERVEPGWLRALLEMQKATGADAVSGRARPEFDGPQPEWTKGLYVFWDGPPMARGPIPMIWTTTNVLLAESAWSGLGAVRFDPVFCETGGSDENYFRRLAGAGARFAHAPDAVSHEHFGPTRATRRWAMARAYRIGSSNLWNQRRLGMTRLELATELVGVPAGAFVQTMMLPLNWGDPAVRMRWALRMSRQLGKAAALVGHHPSEYRVVHGV